MSDPRVPEREPSVTEREAVKRERAAWLAAKKHGQCEKAVRDGINGKDCEYCVEQAAKRYPLPTERVEDSDV